MIRDSANSTSVDDQYRDENGNEVKILEPSNIDIRVENLKNELREDFLEKVARSTIEKQRIIKQFGEYKPLIDSIKDQPNILEIIWWLIKQSPKIIKIIVFTINFINKFQESKMKDLKTTITVIVGAIAYLCNLLFKLEIPSEAIIAVVVFFVGLFAKDSVKK